MLGTVDGFLPTFGPVIRVASASAARIMMAAVAALIAGTISMAPALASVESRIDGGLLAGSAATPE